MAESVGRFQYRHLGSFTYHVVRDPRMIRSLLLKWIVQEWQQDHAQAPGEPWTVEWLERLPGLDFSLQQVGLADVRPRSDLMACRRPGYSFLRELEERVKEREASVQRGCSIEPLLIDGRNMELMDGYVRYTLLCRHHQRLAYAYVGVESKAPRHRMGKCAAR